MAKLECNLKGDFNTILKELNQAVLDKGVSVSLEDSSGFYGENFRCAVRVYERYSLTGGNRVSLNITLCQAEEKIFLSAIASGGSQAVFLKINTFGESSFLESINSVVYKYKE